MKIFILLTFIFLSTSSFAFSAQGSGGYCKNVDSTAASQECLKKHLKSEQERLNRIYEKLSTTLAGDRLSELKDLQQVWLTYRDSECMWESGKLEAPVLKRVSELSCMARVTEDRADLLTVAYSDSTSPHAQREFVSFPRWMNVLANKYPDIYWNYGARIKGDVNCDDEDEYIMTGIKRSEEYSDLHVAIVENPPVGKPLPSLFTFPTQNKEDGEDKQDVCKGDLKIEIKKAILQKDATIEPQCGTSVVLTPKNCASEVINWTGKAFIVAVEEVLIDNKETKKK